MPKRLARLIAIVGPTGSGKSDLALRAAKALDGEIVNCDSLQIYRYFDIGTAKTSEWDRSRIPHHLIDICDPDETFTAGDYQRRARHVIREIAERGRVPFVVGGTGFYLKALLEGLAEGPGRDAELRQRLELRNNRRPGFLHRLLRRLDPLTASRIHHNDIQKLIRAVELCIRSLRPASDLFNQGREALSGFRVLKLGLNPDRKALYGRLNQRTLEMFKTGLLDEVRRLIDAGYPVTAKPFQSLGYKQALGHLSGHLNLSEAVESTQQETRQYAKRQWTWFRRDPEVRWIPGFGNDPAVQQHAIQEASEFLRLVHKLVVNCPEPL